jgi:hypothetical protein
MVKHGNVGIVALQTAEEWVVLGSLMHHSIKNLNPSLQIDEAKSAPGTNSCR